jgi:7,8-dihydro-6-hydroxymethylpterin-pyrophosphokinase
MPPRLDLDMLTYGQGDSQPFVAGAVPRMFERAFVLIPLANLTSEQ